MSARALKAIVVGAGLGGLSAGLSLRDAGIETALFERAASMSAIQVGIGMVLWPNGMRALDAIGVSDRVKDIGAPIETLDLYTASGEPLNSWRIGDVARRVGAPALALSRGELHQVLTQEFESESAIQLGARVVDFADDGDEVTVQFENGSTERADVLVGADGIASGIRRKLTGRGPPEYPPYAGYTIWHSIIPFGRDAVPGGVFFLLFGRGGRFAYYRIDDERVYWSGIAFVPGGQEADIRKPEVLDFFGAYMDPIRGMIEATSEADIQRHDIYGGESLAEWGADRVTLLGDAAHPMTTNLGQGAGMAIEDGVVLGGCLGRGTEPQAGLRAYETRRLERTNTMIELANRLNSDASLEGRFRCWMRNQMIKRMFHRGLGSRYAAFIEDDALG